VRDDKVLRSNKATRSAKVIISRLLDTVGDGSGTKAATGDYSVTPAFFRIKPGPTESFSIERMIVSIEDTAGFAAADYGNIAGGLANGVVVYVENDRDGIVYRLTDISRPIVNNAGWGYCCYDANLVTWGPGNEFLLVRWTFARSGAPVVLRGSLGERLVVALNDDCTGLVEHNFLVQGYIL
jgi:hypothetical protein